MLIPLLFHPKAVTNTHSDLSLPKLLSKLTSSVNTSLFNPKVVTNTSMISESGHWDPLRSRWRRTDSRLYGGTLENARVVLNFRFEGHIYKLVPDGHRHSSHQAGVHLSKNTPKVT